MRTKATLLQANVKDTQLQAYFDLGFIQTLKSRCLEKKL